MNLKVHFAGGDNLTMASILKEAGVNYVLGTIYSLIYPSFKSGKISFDFTIPEYWKENFKSDILDSGIFTLIYGADKNKTYTLSDFQRWQEILTQFVSQSQYRGFPVEVDAQKIIGPTETWKLRETLKSALPNHQVINIWHAQDGQKGLDKLIEFTDYIAFSVQELRKLKSIDHKEYTIKMVNYIKNRKPEIKIHLLACTELKLLQELNFCTSSDSTSWLQVNKFGRLKSIQNGEVKMLTKDQIKNLLPQYHPRALKILQELKANQDRDLTWISSYLCALEEAIKIYSLQCGPQT